MIGKVYAMAPQPPVEEDTTYFPAGNITLGIEYRSLDPESLVETYKNDPAQLAELLDKSPDGGFTDEGLSLHVYGTEDKHLYVRFDVFAGEPHYHYNHPGPDIVNNVIDFDVVAHGDMLPWAFGGLRNRLPEMLAEAGGSALVDGLDRDAISRVVDELEGIAASVQPVTR